MNTSSAAPRRVLAILNPAAGQGTAIHALPEIQARLNALCPGAVVVCTERPWHAAELALAGAKSGNFDVIAAAGGDGTVHEVLNGLMLARGELEESDGLPAIAVLPVGRGNDFGFGVGIPSDLARAFDILATGVPRAIDVGHVIGGNHPEGRYFGNGVGIGFDAIVGFEAAKMRRLSGPLVYLFAALKTILLYHRGPEVRIEYNGKTAQQRSLMISVMNGQRMGGSFLMAPTGDPGDGHLDLCIARQVGRLHILALIPQFMSGTQAGKKPIEMAQTERIVVTATKGTLPAHADGETLCTGGQRLELQLVPNALRVIAPPVPVSL